MDCRLCTARFRDVVADDGRDDAALGRTHDLSLRCRDPQAQQGRRALHGLFVAGYLTVWGAFGVLAVTLQWQLDRIVLLSPMMVTTRVVLGGLLLVGAGLWQFTPLKHACLRYCRSPLAFLSRHWRDGLIGAFRMGVRHGMYCLGCCWMLMLMLFYGGIMNIYWIAGLAVLILVEKMTPPGPRVGSLIGVIFMAWGALLLVGLI
jgi:predicted metal-binding membrane protein